MTNELRWVVAIAMAVACTSASDDGGDGSSSSSSSMQPESGTTPVTDASVGDSSDTTTGTVDDSSSSSPSGDESSSTTAPPVMIDPEGDGDHYEPPPYVLGPDSMPQDGVPQGAVTMATFAASTVFPGTTRDYWVYVPAQYDGSVVPSMVFQDGANYVNPDGPFRTPIVLDNLIAAGDIPVMIAVFVNPGMVGDQSNRSFEYDNLSDAYSQFLVDELLPVVEADFGVQLSDAPEDRGIAGHSSGGICAFTVGWHRPDLYGRLMTHNGSFVDIMGGGAYPQMVLDAEVQPLRVFLLSGTGDLDNQFGNWLDANTAMAAALAQQSYHYRFVHGEGSHSPDHAGAVMPDTLRWLWREPLVEG
jgi:enterochelin esterase family protein